MELSFASRNRRVLEFHDSKKVVHYEVASYVPGSFQQNKTYEIAGVDISNPPDPKAPIDYDARKVCVCKWSDVVPKDLDAADFDLAFQKHLSLGKKKSDAKPRTPKKKKAAAAAAESDSDAETPSSRTPKKKAAAAAAAAAVDIKLESSFFPIPADLATALMSQRADAEFDVKLVYCAKGKNYGLSVDHSPNLKKAEPGAESFTAVLMCKRKNSAKETTDTRPKKKSKAAAASAAAASSSSSSSTAAAAAE